MDCVGGCGDGPPVAAVGVLLGSSGRWGHGLWCPAGCGDGRDPVERGGDLCGPGPGGRDAEASAALATDQAGGGVQDPGRATVRFGAGEVAGHGDELQPGGEVGGDRGQGKPGLVDREQP